MQAREGCTAPMRTHAHARIRTRTHTTHAPQHPGPRAQHARHQGLGPRGLCRVREAVPQPDRPGGAGGGPAAQHSSPPRRAQRALRPARVPPHLPCPVQGARARVRAGLAQRVPRAACAKPWPTPWPPTLTRLYSAPPCLPSPTAGRGVRRWPAEPSLCECVQACARAVQRPHRGVFGHVAGACADCCQLSHRLFGALRARTMPRHRALRHALRAPSHSAIRAPLLLQEQREPFEQWLAHTGARPQAGGGLLHVSWAQQGLPEHVRCYLMGQLEAKLLQARAQKPTRECARCARGLRGCVRRRPAHTAQCASMCAGCHHCLLLYPTNCRPSPAFPPAAVLSLLPACRRSWPCHAHA